MYRDSVTLHNAPQAIFSVNCPGRLTLMTPAHMQLSLDVLLSAGKLATITVGEPGAHGVAVAGMHGMGVNTPMAAVVAAATMGLLGLLHMPKGMMFNKGMWSMMLAAGWLPDITRFLGKTTNELGAMPHVH